MGKRWPAWPNEHSTASTAIHDRRRPAGGLLGAAASGALAIGALSQVAPKPQPQVPSWAPW